MAKKKDRILHITFNMGIGGTEQVIRQLVTSITEYEHQILCIDGNIGPVGETLISQGIKIWRLERKDGFDWRIIFKIRKLIDENDIKIIHCHQYTPFVYGWASSIGKGKTLVFTEHGRFYPDRRRNKAYFVNKIMSYTASSLVAISEATKMALHENEFFPKSKINVIYNGIEPLAIDEALVGKAAMELGIPDDGFVLGTVARLDKVKNQAFMIEAFKEFLSIEKNSYLLIVGDGPERKNLENTAKRLSISDRVIFTGFTSKPENYMGLMDIFLLPSLTEGTSMTLLEAMSLRIPCVVSRVGGNPEIVQDGETGCVFESNNKSQFIDSIVKLYYDDVFYRKCVSNANDVFRNRFSIENMKREYLKVYNL